MQFSDMNEYREKEKKLFDILRHSEGKDHVAIYVRSERAVRKLGENWTVNADEIMVGRLSEIFGRENVKLTYKK